MLVDFLTGITRAIDGALVGHDGEGVASPWHGWLTLVLMRQRSRQAWHRQVVQSLRDVDADADDDEDPDEGAVPGMPGWRFAFHGMGCCLAGPDGEVIDVDHHDEAAAIIDPWFFAWRIASIRTRDLPERRLWRWLPGASVLVVALADLRAMGVLEYPQGDHMFRLCDALEGRVAALAAVDFADPAVTERALRSTTPIAVSDLASMLTAVDQPWCHRELSVALAERPGDSYLAEALRRSCSPEARAAATPYTPPNTTRPASASRTRRSSTTASPRCSPTCPRGTGRSPSSFAAASRPTGPADFSDRSTFTPSRKLEHFRPARPDRTRSARGGAFVPVPVVPSRRCWSARRSRRWCASVPCGRGPRAWPTTDRSGSRCCSSASCDRGRIGVARRARMQHHAPAHAPPCIPSGPAATRPHRL